jgi:hypothetical protein
MFENKSFSPFFLVIILLKILRENYYPELSVYYYPRTKIMKINRKIVQEKYSNINDTENLIMLDSLHQYLSCIKSG